MKFADYFDVPVDYFFKEYGKKSIEIDDSVNDSSMTKVYNVLKSNPNHIASMLKGKCPQMLI